MKFASEMHSREIYHRPSRWIKTEPKFGSEYIISRYWKTCGKICHRPSRWFRTPLKTMPKLRKPIQNRTTKYRLRDFNSVQNPLKKTPILNKTNEEANTEISTTRFEYLPKSLPKTDEETDVRFQLTANRTP